MANITRLLPSSCHKLAHLHPCRASAALISNMTTTMTVGISSLKAGDPLVADVPLICEVSDVRKISDSKYACKFNDGKETISGILASQVSKALSEGGISMPDGSKVRITDAVCNEIAGEHRLIVAGLEVVAPEDGALRTVEANVMTDPRTPHSKNSMDSVKKQATNSKFTPGPTPSPPPSEPPRSAGHTPATGTRPRTNLTPIQGLNPYDQNWNMKAQVTQKYPAKSFNSKGQNNKLFTVELRDEEGSEIRGTFWRESVDKYEHMLQVDKVYYFHKFTVKMANKAYSNLRCDYELNFDGRTEIEACEEAESQSFMATSEYQPMLVPITGLTNYVNRKVTVDVMGVVTSVGGMGTVKRKSDSTELMRRDITMVDQSLKSVTITLWGDNATAKASELENNLGCVLLCTHCRVTDFGGLSLSTVLRSQLTMEPPGESAQALRDWYSLEGQAITFEPIAQSAPNSAGRPGGAGNAVQALLKDIQPADDAVPSADAPAQNFSVLAHVVHIKPDQAMYYLANPETGRKVVEQAPGSYYSESDGKHCATAERRYVLSFKAMDFSGECYLNLFNTEGQALLGMSADELARRKDGGNESEFTTVLKDAQWGEWNMGISAKAREYNGDKRMRYTITSLRKLDYAAQCRDLIDKISRLDA